MQFQYRDGANPGPRADTVCGCPGPGGLLIGWPPLTPFNIAALARRRGRAALGLLCSLSLTALLAGAAQAMETPRRIVAVDAVATEILLASGYGDRLVAVDASSQLEAVDASLPRLGYHRALATEGILGLAPDLVVGSTHMGPPHVVSALERADLQLLRLTPAYGLGQLRKNIDAVLAAVGATDEGAALRHRVAAAEHRLRAQPLSDLRAVFVLSGAGGKLRLAGDSTAGGALIGLMGAGNAAPHANYRTVTAETLLALEPDAIFVASTDGAAGETFLARHPVLRFGNAAARGAVFNVDADTLVAGIGLAALAEAQRLQRRVASVLARR